MNFQNVLMGAFGVQVVLAVITWWPSADRVAARSALPFETSEVTELSVESGNSDAGAVTMKRTGEGWVLSSHHDYPADPNKVDELLDKLGGIKVRTPIAKQSVSHDQLNVGSDPSRTVVLKTASTELPVYLGVAGNNRAHLRLGDASEVYQVQNMGAWSVKDGVLGYVDTEILGLTKNDIETFELTNEKGTIRLFRDANEDWVAEGQGEGQVFNRSRLDGLFRNTLTLRMTEPADPKLDPFAHPGAAIVTWTQKVDEQVETHRVALAVSSDDVAFVRVEDARSPVNIGSYSVRSAFLETTLEGLYQTEEDLPPAPDLPF